MLNSNAYNYLLIVYYIYSRIQAFYLIIKFLILLKFDALLGPPDTDKVKEKLTRYKTPKNHVKDVGVHNGCHSHTKFIPKLELPIAKLRRSYLLFLASRVRPKDQ